MIAALARDGHAFTPDGDAIYRDVALPAGEYTVFVQMAGDNRPRNDWCANIHVNTDSGQEVGVVIGNGRGPSGWSWRRVDACVW